jgi:HAMP domain-containing protein/HPt (histidine-containing phosphotransfer) domain-containing protein
MKPRFALTIYHKLLALIIALMVAVVGALALYLSAQQISAMTAALRTKATTYGSVMASQATSAVAFSDRETAREVLQSVDADADVASVVLYGSGGTVLYSRGEPTAGVAADDVVVAARAINTASRIAAVTPVVSLEGPRGVLVIELSTDSLRAARARVHWLALMTGIVAIACGAIAAWWIARRLARRLRAIAKVAGAVAGGDLTQRPIDDPQRDEIGALAAAFNAMLSQIKQLLADVQDMARREQERLATLVAQRTAQLDQRTAEMQLVFDQVDQGLVIVDLDGRLASERSAAVERLLGPVPASGMLCDYVRAFAPDMADWFAMQWEMVGEDILPPELCLAQLPTRFEVARRHLELGYKLTEGHGPPRVLVVISDVTARSLRQRAERDDRETASLLSRMLRGRVGFLSFHAEAGQYIAAIAAGPRDDVGFRRTVHTLKGIAALEGIDSISEQCNLLENALSDRDELAALACARAIGARWELVTSKIAPLIAEASARVELLPADLAQIEGAVLAGAAPGELLAMIESWRHERVAHRLQRFADDAHVLAARFGKGAIDVKVEVADDVRLPSERWAGFWTAFVHAIRNAIDHGIEVPDERSAAGKPPAARLTLRAGRVGDEFAIEIEDDGRGVDWARVAELAAVRGLPAGTPGELVDALFCDGFSTREVSSETSGRGVGLPALRQACAANGGHVTLTSRPGAGTTLGFRWPIGSAQRESLQLAG